MTDIQEIELPDIGDFEEIDVIEILVKPGDKVNKEDPLIMLESDKATMEIPSPEAGIIHNVNVSIGDKISQGQVILSLEKVSSETQPEPVETSEPEIVEPDHQQNNAHHLTEVKLPNIGDFESVDVIEILVKPGDQISAEDAIITLESDKASMEIPSPYTGTVKELKVQLGDKIAEGNILLLLETSSQQSNVKQPVIVEPEQKTLVSPLELTQPMPAPVIPEKAEKVRGSRSEKSLASPAVRKLARELGVDLGLVQGNGPRGRILKEDVKSYTKSILEGSNTNARFSLPEIPAVDFSKFGSIQLQPLSRIKQLTGQHLQRAWLTVPQVTQFEKADITDLEEFRQSRKAEAKDKGTSLTLITFLIKAVVVALKKYPEFNSSLTSDSDALVLKQYFHIGLAVNTENGLVVPVIRNADQKNLFDIALEITKLSEKARTGVLKPDEMQGGCFTISSLGSIGGTGFTPIVNAPEVAILGVSKSEIQPVYENDQFVPRLILPFGISYDHRVIDGVAAAQFTGFLREILSDIRQILL